MSLAGQSWCPTSVQVTVLQARGLKTKGKSGTNDAYALIQVGKEKYQTAVVEKTVAPVWKEEAAFDLQPPLPGGGGRGERGTLHVHVLHRALVGPDKQLGQAVINLLQLSEDKTRSKTEWFKLLDKTGKADKDRGEVLLDIQFMRNNMTASMFDLSAAGKSRSRLGKFKDKVRGKKKESDTLSGVVPSFSQVLTDSEDEAGEEDAVKGEKKKKHKIKSLFSPKSNLQRNMSQSMSVLPAKNSSLSGSQSSGLNVESTEGKKKFKFMIHKRTGSSDSKISSSGHPKHGIVEQTNLCINGSHVYCEEPQPRASRIGSNFSLGSSGHGSMEDVPESSPPSVDSLRAVKQYSPWTEEEEEEEETIEVENTTEDMDELRREEEDRIRVEEEMRRKEEERVRKEEEALKKLAEEKFRQREEERKRIEKEEEEERVLREEERKRGEEQERVRREERERLAEEMRRLEEEKRKRIEEEEERIRLKGEKAQEERRRQDEDERRRKLEEEERIRREEERVRKENGRLIEERRRLEERRQKEEEEEERLRMEEAQRRKQQEVERVQREEVEREEKRLEEQERMRIEAERQKAEEERIRKEVERLSEENQAIKEKEEYERLEDEERIRIEDEKRRQEEEDRFRKEKEEYERLEEEKRRLEEEKRQKEEEERIKKEEQERSRIEDEMRRQEEEDRVRKEKEEYERLEEEKRRLEEEKRQKEEEERIKKEEQERIRIEDEMRMRQEEDRVRKEKEEYERLEEEKRRLEEEKRQKEEEERIKKEEQERSRIEDEMRMRQEEDRVRKEKEEYERLEEEKRRLEEEKRQKEEEERIKKEEQERSRIEGEMRRQEEEYRSRKEKEEHERLIEEKRRLEEEERKQEEERIRNEEQARIEAEKRREEEEERKKEMERLSEEERKLEERNRRLEEEEIRRVENKNLGTNAEQMKRENEQKDEDGAARQISEGAVESPAQVKSTNPFDENFSSNPFDDSPTMTAGPDNRNTEVSNIQQGCHSAVPSVRNKTISTHEKELISARRERRPAPQPPGRNQTESQIEQDAAIQHLTQMNNQSNDKDVANIFPQQWTQMVAPLSQSPTNTKSQSVTDSTTKGTESVAKHGKCRAPSRPRTVEEEPSPDPKTDVGGKEKKQDPVTYGFNPFEDDEDELTTQDDTKTLNTGAVHWPPPLSKAADKDAASQAKFKSSKGVRAPPPPSKKAAILTPLVQNTDGGHVMDDTGVAVSEAIVSMPVHGTPLKEPQPVRGQEVPPTTSRRLQSVKPLKPPGQQCVSIVQGEKYAQSTATHCEVQEKTKLNDPGLKGPYSQLTREELVSLVLKQEKQLSGRDAKISELEQYIDNLLVRVMEEKPSILLSLSSLTKAV